MEGGHTVQPRLPQFGRGAVAPCQTVMEVQQLLGVILVSLGSGVRGQKVKGIREKGGKHFQFCLQTIIAVYFNRCKCGEAFRNVSTTLKMFAYIYTCMYMYTPSSGRWH